jgi:hypothetical protein
VAYPIIEYIDLGLHLLPVLAGIYCRSYRIPLNRYLFVFVVLNIVSEITLYITASHGVGNQAEFQLYILFCTLLVFALYRKWLMDAGSSAARYVTAAPIIFFVFWVASKMTVEPITHPPEYTLNVSNLMILMLSVYGISLLNRVPSDIRLTKMPIFWITAGLFIYSAGNVLPFLSYSSFVHFPRPMALAVWSVNWSLSCVANICYTIAFLCTPRG